MTLERGIRPALSLFSGGRLGPGGGENRERYTTRGRAPFGPLREDQDTSWLYRYLQEPKRTVR